MLTALSVTNNNYRLIDDGEVRAPRRFFNSSRGVQMKFTRIVYGLAAAYGFVSLLPLYFLIEKLGNDAPPAITHAEFYYRFVGLALLWQFVFVLIRAANGRTSRADTRRLRAITIDSR